MRIGLIARATMTGLGYQTRSFWHGMKPEETLVVTDINPLLEEHLDWYEDVYVQTIGQIGNMHNLKLRRFFRQIDVLFGAETLYGRYVYEMARDNGVRTVVQANPELTREPEHRGWIGDPDEYVWPTSWMVDRLGGRILRVPVDPTLEATAGDPEAPFIVVHVAGRRAVGDRNGSDGFVEALHSIKSRVTVRYVVQDRFTPIIHEVPSHVKVEVMTPEHRSEIYDGAHLLVMPRKYGGLCLPTQEAMKAGLAVMMNDCSPNHDWPIIPLACTKGRMQRVPRGAVVTWDAHRRAIAYEIDRYNRDREALAMNMKRSLEWAEQNTWDKLRPQYEEVLGGC